MIEITSGRQCGSCSLCCKLLHVIELNKPANQWCGHCKPGKGGCTIHETRPDICRGYYCGWMLSDKVGPEWFPLVSRMIISLGKFNGVQLVTVTVDPSHPGKWMEPPYYAQLKQMASRGLHVESAEDILLVHVRIDNRVWLMLPHKDVEITRGSYVMKRAARDEWEVEQFKTNEEAAERVATLAPHEVVQMNAS